MTKKHIHLIYRIALSIALIIAGICLMAACIGIYQSGGEQIYTPQKVAAAFAPISLPVYIALVLILVGFVLDIALPLEKKRILVEKQYALMLSKACEYADMSLCEPELQKKIFRKRNTRRLHWLITLALLLAGMAIAAGYGLNPKHYHEELSHATESVIQLVWWLLPCTVIPLGYGIFSAYYSHASIRRELELVKQVPKKADKSTTAPKKPTCKTLYIRLAVLGIALGILVGGFIAGGTADVLAKAVAICTECVGLG